MSDYFFTAADTHDRDSEGDDLAQFSETIFFT